MCVRASVRVCVRVCVPGLSVFSSLPLGPMGKSGAGNCGAWSYSLLYIVMKEFIGILENYLKSMVLKTILEGNDTTMSTRGKTMALREATRECLQEKNAMTLNEIM